MDFARFVEDNREGWRELEALVAAAETAGLRSLSADDVRSLVRSYRKASADLLLAREESSRADVVDYLEALVGRAYGLVYAGRRLRWAAIPRYVTRDWPRAVRRERRFVATAAAAFGLGLLLAFVATMLQPEAFYAVVPASTAGFYGERPDDYRAQRFQTGDGVEMTDQDAILFSAQLMANNVKVTLLAFALGLTLVGSLVVLFHNGVLLGAIAANFLQWDQSLELWALILPHGVTEIFAMLLGGAGGLLLGDGLLRPGRRQRLDAVRERGLRALQLLGGAVLLLCFAGLVEAWFTPLASVPPVGKLAFAALTAGGLALWIRAPWLDESA